MDGENKIEKSRNPAQQVRNFSPFKFVIFVFAFIILLNLAYVDWLLFFEGKQVVIEEPISFTPVSPVVQEEENSICPQSCVSQIQEATASLKLTTTVPPTASGETRASAGAKEFFVPFGSGSNSSSDWKDVEGLQAYIDSTNFEGVKKVTFEASLRIPTGNQTAYVRLFNKTDKHPVWFSEVSVTGGTPALLISEPITLDKGNKLYQVQMKTQLQFSAILDQARIHIITD